MSPQTRQSRLAAFFAAEYNRLVGYVRTLIEDAAEQDAEDFVQDVAVKLLSLADITAPIENLSAYVYRALRNRVIDAFRVRRRHASLDADLPGTEGMTLADILHDTRYCTDTQVARRDLARILQRAIGELRDDERSVVVANEIEGTPFHVLAGRWDIPLNTLLSRKARAMKKIRRRYGELLSEMGGHHVSPVP